MSYFANFLELITTVTLEGKKVEKNNPEILKQNIKKLHDDFVKENFSRLDGGKLVRIFNDLYGSYPQLEGRLEYLNAAVDSEKFEIYYNDILAFSYTELFDEQGNLLPSIKAALNYNDFLTNLLKNKSPEEIEKFYGFLLSSFCTNIIGTIVWSLYGESNLELAKLFIERMYKDMAKPLDKANTQRLLAAGLRTDTAAPSNNPAPSNERVTKPAAVALNNSKVKELPNADKHPHFMPVSEVIAIMPEVTNAHESMARLHIKNPVVAQPQKRAFAETSTGKILIASLTAMLVSPILVGAAAAIGITFPFSVPVVIVITAIFFGVTSGFLTKVADWIGGNLAARKQKYYQAEVIVGNNDLSKMTSSYVNIGQKFSQRSSNNPTHPDEAQQEEYLESDDEFDPSDMIDSIPTKMQYQAFPKPRTVVVYPEENNKGNFFETPTTTVTNS